MNLSESYRKHLKETNNQQYYSVKVNICGVPEYLDNHGLFVSETIDALHAYPKEKAEEILNKELKHNPNSHEYEIVPVDYKPSKEELDKLYKQLEDLNKEYESECEYSTSSDGSLGMISTQISQTEEQIEELKKELNESNILKEAVFTCPACLKVVDLDYNVEDYVEGPDGLPYCYNCYCELFGEPKEEDTN